MTPAQVQFFQRNERFESSDEKADFDDDIDEINPRHTQANSLFEGGEVWLVTRGDKLRMCTHDFNMYTKCLSDMKDKSSKASNMLRWNNYEDDQEKKAEIEGKRAKCEEKIKVLEELLVLYKLFRDMVDGEIEPRWRWRKGLRDQVVVSSGSRTQLLQWGVCYIYRSKRAILPPRGNTQTHRAEYSGKRTLPS